MSTHRVTARYRAVVLPSSHEFAHHRYQHGADLPADFPQRLGAGAHVLPLFEPLSTATMEPTQSTQSVPLSLPDTHLSTAWSPLTWTFKPVTEANAVGIGRDPTTSPDGTKHGALLPHAYASRQHCQMFVTAVSFGYNKSAETQAVTVKQVGKNPTFVDGVALRKDETKAIRLFNPTAGAEGYASLAALRAAEACPPLSREAAAAAARTPWGGGCNDGHLVVPVRLVVGARLSFPAEFSTALPVVLLVAEVVMPSYAAAAAPSLSALSLGAPAPRHNGRSAYDAPSPTTSFVADALDLPGRNGESALEPPSRAHRAEGSTIAGIPLLPSSDEEDDDGGVAAGQRARADMLRRLSSAGTRPSEPAPAAPSKMSAWAAAVEQAAHSPAGTTGGAPLLAPAVAKRAKTATGPSAAKKNAPVPVVRLASDDDIPLLAPMLHPSAASAQPAKQPPAAAMEKKAASPPRPPAPAAVIIDDEDEADTSRRDALARASTSNHLLPPRQAPAAAEACAWQWKSSRHRRDDDDAAWTSYSSADTALIEAAFARGAPRAAVAGGGFEVVFGLAGAPHRQAAADRPGGADRTVRRVTGPAAAAARASAPLAAAVGAALGGPGGAADSGSIRWIWNSNADLPDAHPRAWKPYPPADVAKLEAAYQRGEKTCDLSASYAVVFNDANVGMAQYRRDDPSRWRAVRRHGPSARASPPPKVKIVAGESDSSSGSWVATGSDDDYSGVASSSEEWDDSSSDYDSDEDRRRREAKKAKKAAAKNKPK